MFYLLNKELSFEVDVTACGCGMNYALYFISMESDGGQASSGYTGATYGTGYCDARSRLSQAVLPVTSWARIVDHSGGDPAVDICGDSRVIPRIDTISSYAGACSAPHDNAQFERHPARELGCQNYSND